MKKALIILSILAAAFAAFIVIFPDLNPLKNLFKKGDGDNPDTGNTGNPPVVPPVVPPVTGTGNQSGEFRLGFPLSKGSKGSYVSAMQTALNKKYNTSLTIDGDFGSKTYRALSVNGFNPDSVTYSDYLKIIS